MTLFLTDTEREQLRADLARAEHLAREHARILAGCRAILAGPPVDMLAVDLGAPTGHHPAVATMPVADVPVDGSVEVRPVTGSGRFGPWVHVIGEQQAVGGGDNRSLLVDGLVEPFTWHRDQCVQVRPFRPADEDLVDAMHRIETGGL